MIRNNHGPNTSHQHHRLFQLVRPKCRSIYLSFILSLNSSTASSRCRSGLLHLVTLNDTHKHIHTISLSLGRIRLDEGSARRKNLSLTTHNTHKRQTSMPPTVFQPAIAASERPQTYCLRTRSRSDRVSI